MHLWYPDSDREKNVQNVDAKAEKNSLTKRLNFVVVKKLFIMT